MDKSQLQKEALSLLIGAVATYCSVKLMVYLIDPQRKQKDDAKAQKDALLKRLELPPIPLDPYECMLCSDVLNPDDISVQWADIGGLREVKKAIKELIVAPLRHPYLFSGSKLLHPPKGILLYGPPGTGKTMMAKAIAKQSGARFINLSQSTLQNKWFGESVKLVRAVFTLAAKLQPAIVFIDEIDSFLRERDSSDHQAHSDMKCEFMTLWDGIGTDVDAAVVVLGASNRPWDIDQAIQRRLSRAFAIGLPEQPQRRQILQKVLKDERLEPPFGSFDFEELARRTGGYSGSDLAELCSGVAYAPVRDHLAAIAAWKRGRRRRLPAGGASVADVAAAADSDSCSSDEEEEQGAQGTAAEAAPAPRPARQLRPLCLEDFIEVIDSMPTTQQQSRSYQGAADTSAGSPDQPLGGAGQAGQAAAGPGARAAPSLITQNFVFQFPVQGGFPAAAAPGSPR